MSNANFNKAVEDIKNLKATPKDVEVLELYALFKQGSIGDVNTERPGLHQFRGKAKWDAWNGKKGMSSADAKEAYVALANKLISTYGLK